MTSRQTLNLRKRRVRLTAAAGLLTFVGSLGFAAAMPGGRETLPLRVGVLVCGAIGFAVALVTLLVANLFAFRCPSCRRNLALLVEQLGTPFSVDRRIQCCPFCRADLDADPLTGKPPTDSGWEL